MAGTPLFPPHRIFHHFSVIPPSHTTVPFVHFLLDICPALEQRLSQLDRLDFSPKEQMDLAKKLTVRFLESVSTNRELLVSLIERVELTSDKQIIIKFRFKKLEVG